MKIKDTIGAVVVALKHEGHEGLGEQLQLTIDAKGAAAERYRNWRLGVARVLSEKAISGETRALASTAYEALSRALG